VNAEHLGFSPETGELITMRVQAQSIGETRASRAEKLPNYEAWEEYIHNFSNRAPEGLREVF